MATELKDLLARIQRETNDILQEGLSPLCIEIVKLIGSCSQVRGLIAGMTPEDAAPKAKLLRALGKDLLQEGERLPEPEQLREAIAEMLGLTAQIAISVANEISPEDADSD